LAKRATDLDETVRILFLTQYFEPEPLVKGLIFARALVAQGHEVQVVTGFPNYPGGRVYDGYRVKPYQRERMGDVTVHRVPLYPDHSRSPLRRGANYLSFALAASAVGPVAAFRPHVVYVYHSPATLAIPAAVLKLFKQTRLVCDIQDLWPETVFATGMGDNGLLRRPLTWLCQLTYLAPDRIVVPAPGMKRLLTERDVDPRTVEVIYNWAGLGASGADSPQEASRRAVGWNPQQFVVLFAGQMGLVQGLDTVIDAAALLRDTAPHVLMAFIGGGVEAPRLAKRAADEGLHNVRFYPRVPPDAVGSYLSAADALLVHLKKEPLFEAMIPSKTQTYMAAGRPIVMAVNGDAADLIRRAECGVTSAAGDPRALAAAVKDLADRSPEELAQTGRNGAAFYHRELSLESGVQRFDELFRSIAHDA